MSWLWADRIEAQSAQLAPDEVRHLERVLRARRGQRVRLIDGKGVRASGEWRGDAEVMVDERERLPEPRVTLCLAVGSRAGTEESVRRAAELGARRICLAQTQRGRDAGGQMPNMDRLAQIARSGCAQSGNPWLPHIEAPRPWPELVATESPVALAPSGADLLLDLPEPAAVAVGPEGGWTGDELIGCATATLGPWVLRTEVAVAVALGILASRLPRDHACIA
jgi:16S rRNA (uracil1498-N3)-methyltransferase